MQRSILLAISATIILAFAAPAAAETHMAAPKAQRVSYAELDLTSAYDADTLLTRIRAAAREVCDIQGGMNAMDEFVTERACRRQTVANAVAALGNPMVTQRYAMNGRTRTVTMASR
jgi:UrcA family protein